MKRLGPTYSTLGKMEGFSCFEWNRSRIVLSTRAIRPAETMTLRGLLVNCFCESLRTAYQTYSDTSFWLSTIFSSAIHIEQGAIQPPFDCSSYASERERAIGMM